MTSHIRAWKEALDRYPSVENKWLKATATGERDTFLMLVVALAGLAIMFYLMAAFDKGCSSDGIPNKISEHKFGVDLSISAFAMLLIAGGCALYNYKHRRDIENDTQLILLKQLIAQDPKGGTELENCLKVD